ncbi:hypothetical protein CMU93_05750 [Elizabethkingia anophelis]|nr:hypothetical protein [Elizabethkingia anophelis]
MKLKYYNKTALALLTLSFLISSCRSVGSENPENITDPPINVGDASVVVNLLDSEFLESDGNNPKASTGKQPRNLQATETFYTLTDPSTLLAVEVSEETSVPLNTSAGINPVAAVDGDPLVDGTKFRLIAYKVDGSYAGYKDFTVGVQSTTGGLRLPKDVLYWMVVYSYGTNYLPVISSGEALSLGSAKHTYDNMNGQNGFLYQMQMFTPQEGDNTMSVVLRHKIAQVTTKINSSALSGSNYISEVSSAILRGNNRNAEFKLSDGSAASRSILQNLTTTFSAQSPTEWTSNAVFVNAASNPDTDKIISFSADVAVNSGTAKPVVVTNGFRIKPGYRTTFKINLKKSFKCGAYLGRNQTDWREFMCYNLGADSSENPFGPVTAAMHGAKYQWGYKPRDPMKSDDRYLTAKDDQDNRGKLNWNFSDVLPSGWNDNSKGVNDPCPEGYRVPSDAELTAVFLNQAGGNEIRKYGSWTGNHFDAALDVISNKTGELTLRLPLAGSRHSAPSAAGANTTWGTMGIYWSGSVASVVTGSINNSVIFQFVGTVNNSISLQRAQTLRSTGASVRCIKEN